MDIRIQKSAAVILKQLFVALAGGAVIGLILRIPDLESTVDSISQLSSGELARRDADGKGDFLASLFSGDLVSIDRLRSISKMTVSSLQGELTSLLATDAFSQQASSIAGLMLGRLIEINPEAAFQWLSRNNYAFATSDILRNVFSEWGARDFERFQDIQRRITSRPVRVLAIGVNLSRMMEVNPEFALATIRQLDGETELKQQSYIAWGKIDPDAAFLRAAADGEQTNQSILSLIVQGLAHSDPKEAIALIAKIKNTGVSDRLKSDLSLEIAINNSEESRSVIELIREPALKDETLWAAYAKLSVDKPSQAISALIELPESPQKWDLIGRTTISLASSPHELSRLLLELPSAHYQQQVLDTYIARMDLKEPVAALEWAATIPERNLARDAVAAISRRNGADWDLVSARRYIIRLPLHLRSAAAGAWVDARRLSADPGYDASEFDGFLSSFRR